MNKEKYIAALEEVCENSNGCVNCPIAKNNPVAVGFCNNTQFEDMEIPELVFYAEIAGLNISDEDPVTPEEDLVNHPNHYTSGGIECIDAIAASMTPIEYAGFLKGQVLKYVWRYRLKGNPAQDLKKTRFYLDRLIQLTEKEEVAV